MFLNETNHNNLTKMHVKEKSLFQYFMNENIFQSRENNYYFY